MFEWNCVRVVHCGLNGFMSYDDDVCSSLEQLVYRPGM